MGQVHAYDVMENYEKKKKEFKWTGTIFLQKFLKSFYKL